MFSPARRSSKRPRLLAEELDPRILYSADAAALLGLSGPTDAALVREFTPAALPARPADVPQAVAAQAQPRTQAQAGREIVFIDSRVPDAMALADQLMQQSGNGHAFEIVMLDATQDGVAQIDRALVGERGLSAIHIISHGSDGAIDIGSTRLDASTLARESDGLARWGQALEAGGDILLYGCNVASDAAGRSFVQELGRLTGADVAASTDLTANAAQGGNWALEYQSGQVETSSLVDQQVPLWAGVLAITSNGTDSSTSTTGATSLTWSHTVAGGADRALFAEIAIDGLGAPVTSVTYGGVTMTRVVRGAGNHAVEIWELVAPAVGTANVVVSFGGSTAAAAGATSFNGVDQTNPSGASASASGTGTTASVNVASAVGDIVIDVSYWDNNPIGGSIGAGQTLAWSQSNPALLAGSTTEAGASSVSMSTSVGASAQWEVAAASIRAAPQAAPVNTVPSAQSTNEDTPRVFSAANGNQISIADADAGGAENEITLTVTNGTLTLAGMAGLTFTSGDGTADATMTLRGTAGAINAALDGLSYSPTANYSGSATLTLATKDSTLLSLDVDTGLLGHYTFENTGALGTDTSPAAGYAGTRVGDASAVNDGMRGNVLSLAGAGYVQTTGHFGDPASLTLGAWVNLSSADASGAEVISLGDYVALRLDQGGKLKGYFNDGAGYRFTELVTTLAGTGWHYVAYSVDSTNDAQVLYLDGTAVATTNYTGAVSWGSAGGANSFIGTHGNGATTVDFNGRIDEARVYDRALTAAEIAALAVDQSLTDTDTVAIAVSAVNDAPVITSNAGGAGAAVSVAENTSAVTTVTSTDIDGGTAVYSILAGGDAARFAINASTGVLTFVTAPDYEAPTDAGANNVYDLTVQVSDGNGGTDTQALVVTVTNVASTLVVTTTADSNDTGLGSSFTAEQLNANKGADGAISLREAIIAANTTAGTDTITFNITGAAGFVGTNGVDGRYVINLASALPSLNEAVVIDATTQTAAAGNSNVGLLGTGGTVGVDGLTLSQVSRPEIELVGNSSIASGFDLNAGNVVVRGFALRGFGSESILLRDAFSGSLIEQNVFGSGATAFTDPGAGNRSGVHIRSLGADGVTIQNNLIGFADATGIYASTGSNGWIIRNNEIVDVGVGFDNGDGIAIGASTGTLIQGNRIAGSSTQAVLLASGAVSTTISNNTITGNNVGRIGAAPIQLDALAVRSGASGVAVSRNIIAANYGTGVRVDSGAAGISISQNSIYANGTITARDGSAASNQVGIDLQSASDDISLGTAPFHTANDAGDADSGGNNLQNFPLLVTALSNGSSQVVIAGRLNSSASSDYRIEFFASATVDASGYGEGQRYLGFINLATDGAGNGSFSATLAAVVAGGEFITATATRSDSTYTTFTDTSEFSAATVAFTTPVNTVPGAQNTNEDTVLVFSSANGNAISIADADAGGANNEVTLSVGNGTLTLAGTAGLTFTAGDGTADATMTLRGTASAINTALDGLSYNPTANYNGGATLTLATADSTLLSLDIGASLLGRYAFESSGALGTDTSPAAGYPGTVSGATAVVDGARGNVLNLGGNDDIQTTGRFGDPANVTLAAWVNLTTADAGGSEVISLGDSVALRLDSGGLLRAFWYDGSAFDYLDHAVTLAGTGWHHVAFAFNDAGNTATLYLDGAAVANSSTTTSISYTLGADSFIGKHGNGVTAYDFTGRIDDARIYNRALSASEIATLASDLTMTDADTVAITIAAVNDAPSATNLNAPETYTEDTALDLTDIVISDVDSATVTATLTLSNASAGSLNTTTSGAVTSTYVAGTGVWSASGALADVNTLLAGLTFTPTANFNSSFTIATSVSDGVAGPVPGTKSITGTAVNDAPSASNLSTAETYTEDTALNLTGIVISDVDSANVNATLTLSNAAAGSLNTATSGAVTSTYVAGTGLWSASGALADVNSLLTGLTFTPTANFNGNFTITTSVSDGVAAPASGTKSMSGTAVNDAPTATNLSTAESYTEDTALNLTDIVISDVDSANVTATLTLSNIAAGSLNTATSGPVTSTYVAGTGVWSASGAIADVNALLAGLTFTPTANFNSSFTIATSVSDGVAAPVTGSKAITGTAVNDAPSASNLSTAETYTEGTALNLTDVAISDVDSANVTATLTLSNIAAGSLNTATSGAVTSTYAAGTGVWTASGAIADVNALLAGLTFTPASNFNSSFTIATSVSDGVAAPVTGTKSMSGTAVNDAPTATNLSAAETYTEDTALNLTDIVISDVDSANVTATLTLSSIAAGSLNTATSGAVTSTYAAGTGVWSASGALADVNSLLAGLTFTPTANFNGNFTITTSLSDGVAAPVTGSKSMTGTAVNDAPSATNLSAGETYTEDTALNLTDIVIGDVDSANVTATLTLSNMAAGALNTTTSGAVTSTYVAATGVWSASGALADVNALLAGLTFSPASNFNSNFTIATSVSDGVAAPVTGSTAITGTAVNDAPGASNLTTAETYTEDTALNLTDIVISDGDSTNATATMTLSNAAAGSLNTATSGAVTSTYVATTGVWSASGAIADVNALLAGLTFTPTANFNSSFTVATSVSDGVAAPLTGSKAITGAAVNDAPVLTTTAGALAFIENAAPGPIDIGLSIVDVDSANLAGAIVRITTSYANGEDLLAFTDQLGISGNWNTSTGTLTLSGAASVASYQSALRSVSYQNTSDNPSIAMRTVEFLVDDGSAMSNAATRQVQVVSIDDAPVTNDTSASGAEDSAPIAVTLNGSDVDGTVTRFRLIGLPANGTLYTDATLTTAAASGTDYAAAGQALTLYFVPAATWSGSTAFQFVARDAAGMTDPTPATASITVAPVNDAPTIAAPAAASVAEDGTLVFSAGAITVRDSDAAGAPVQVSLHVADGALNLSTTTGLAFSVGDGNADATLVFSGQLSDINAALVGLRFTAPADFDGVTSLQIDIDDLGNQGSGGPRTASQVVTLTVTPVNDAPTGLPTIVGTATEDQTLAVDASAIADADGLGPFSTQWLRNGVAVAGATGTSYSLGAADVGTQISVQVSYVDAQGTSERLASAPTVGVAGVDKAPTSVPVTDRPPAGDTTTAPPNEGATGPAMHDPMTTVEPVAPRATAAPATDPPIAATRRETATPTDDGLDAPAVDASTPDTSSVAGRAAAVAAAAHSHRASGAGLRGAASGNYFDLVARFATEEESTAMLAFKDLSFVEVAPGHAGAPSRHDGASPGIPRPADDTPLAGLSLADAAAASGMVLTAGTVWWALRAGGLVTSLLVSMPAWRHADLLAVLPDDEDDNDWDLADDEQASRDEEAVGELLDPAGDGEPR